jgi:hypothetical protein
MDTRDEELRQLLAAPREGFDLELKQWIDPKAPEGIAKIAKGCIALRNNNGGRMVIGFKDDGTPDMANTPADVRATFHVDVVQEIVSRYSSEMFAVDVEFATLPSGTYPVISVPAGVRTPVAAKADLPGPTPGKPFVKDHAVYVRSLNSNNIVSSTEARRGDWDRLARICFDNREADIGGFVRRHLAALNLESLAALVPAFATMLHRPTPTERVVQALNAGRGRYDAALRVRRVLVPDIGTFEVVVIVDGDFQLLEASESFRRRLMASAPNHSGWPPWADLAVAADEELRPYVKDDGWEALFVGLEATAAPFGPHLDFWRMEPLGVFYHLRGLEDDLAQARGGPPPRTELDFSLQVNRVTEVISTGLSFARSLGCDEAQTSVIFGFRWTGLQGRHLTSWGNPRRVLRPIGGVANQDQIVRPVTVPLDTPPAGIAPHVEKVVRGVFALFGGREFDSPVIEEIVAKMLRHRL